MSLNPKRCLTNEDCEVVPEMEYKLRSYFSNFDRALSNHQVIELSLLGQAVLVRVGV